MLAIAFSILVNAGQPPGGDRWEDFCERLRPALSAEDLEQETVAVREWPDAAISWFRDAVIRWVATTAAGGDLADLSADVAVVAEAWSAAWDSDSLVEAADRVAALDAPALARWREATRALEAEPADESAVVALARDMARLRRDFIELGDSVHAWRAAEREGDLLLEAGKFEQALLAFNAARSSAIAFGSPFHEAGHLMEEGKCLLALDRYEEGKAHLEASRERFSAIGHRSFVADSIEHLAIHEFSREMFAAALPRFMEVVRIREQVEHGDSLGIAYDNLANCLAELGEREQALANYDRAVALLMQSENKAQLANAQLNRSITLARLDRPEETVEQARMALATFERVDDAEGAILAGTVLTRALRHLGDYDGALHASRSALPQAERHGDERLVADVLTAIVTGELSPSRSA